MGESSNTYRGGTLGLVALGVDRHIHSPREESYSLTLATYRETCGLSYRDYLPLDYPGWEALAHPGWRRSSRRKIVALIFKTDLLL
jgi:hypothetical protein